MSQSDLRPLFGNGPPPAGSFTKGRVWYDTSTDPFTPYVFSATEGWVKFGASSLQKSVVDLTADQLNHLNSAPAVLVPAPGAGKFISLLKVTTDYKFNTTDPQRGGQIYYLPDVGNTALTVNIFYIYGASTIDTEPALQNGNGIARASVENQPVVLWVGPDDGRAGDSTMRVTTYYTVEDLL